MTTPIKYALGKLFVLRMTGFPVEQIQSLSSKVLAEALDRAVLASQAADASRQALIDAIADQPSGRKVRAQAERFTPITATVVDAYSEPVRLYADALSKRGRAFEEASTIHVAELERIRRRLYQYVSDERFRHVMLLSSDAMEGHVPAPEGPLPPRNAKLRQRETAWVAYLQRLTTKNDTVSFFGPSAWGEIDLSLQKPMRLELADDPIAERTVFFERWPCEALVQLISAEPEFRQQLRPTLRDDVLVEGGRAIFLAEDRAIELSVEERELIARCDGRTPLLALESNALVDGLVEKQVLSLQLLLQCSPQPLELLRAEVASWPAGPAQQRWRQSLEELAGLVGAIGQDAQFASMKEGLHNLRDALVRLGVDSSVDSRNLYVSRFPVNENCRRATTHLKIGAPLVEQITVELAPWYEMWRDLAGLYATRLSALLEPVFRGLAADGPVRLPAFFAAAGRAGIPLGQTAGTGIPRTLEGEIQAAWQAELGDRLKEPELQLTEHDLGFLRRRFEFRRMKGFDWPIPDLQIAAPSAEAVEQGRYQLVLAEMHPAYSAWFHAFFAWCPDPAALASCYQHSGYRPALEFAPSTLWDGPVHIFNYAPLHVPGWTFTGPLRVAGQHYKRGAEITVHLEDHDIVARGPDQEFLGSLVNTWLVAISTHRLELLGLGASSPRLMLGRTVVQRQSWHLDITEGTRQKVEAGGVEALVALRGLMSSRKMPEQTFVRPMFPIHGTHHKDAKPMFVDFQSPLQLEVLARAVLRYRSFRFTEMLPRLEECWLGDKQGHYSFEIRPVPVPAE